MNRDTRIKLLNSNAIALLDHGSSEWNSYIDICQTVDESNEVTLGRMIDLYETDVKYYECYLGPLLANHIIEIKE